jgi:hypothetical protein
VLSFIKLTSFRGAILFHRYAGTNSNTLAILLVFEVMHCHDFDYCCILQIVEVKLELLLLLDKRKTSLDQRSVLCAFLPCLHFGWAVPNAPQVLQYCCRGRCSRNREVLLVRFKLRKGHSRDGTYFAHIIRPEAIATTEGRNKRFQVRNSNDLGW